MSNGVPGRWRIEAGFVDGSAGRLFAVDVLPEQRARGALVFVPAFAEEMNKSRHLVAATARALAGAGFVVHLPDLYGTGDSDGELCDASWALWRGDLADRVRAVRERFGLEPVLWAMRAGALLALDLMRTDPARARRALLWQPSCRGRQAMTEFLRLYSASAIVSGGERAETPEQLRARLDGAAVLEVAGYPLPAELLRAFDETSLDQPPADGTDVRWLEVVAAPGRPLGALSRRVVASWQERGVSVEAVAIHGPSFWRSAELQSCPAIVRASLDASVGLHA